MLNRKRFYSPRLLGPEKRKHQVCVRLCVSTKRLLASIASRHGMSVSGYLANLIDAHLVGFRTEAK